MGTTNFELHCTLLIHCTSNVLLPWYLQFLHAYEVSLLVISSGCDGDPVAYVEVNNMYVYLGKILHCNKKIPTYMYCTVTVFNGFLWLVRCFFYCVRRIVKYLFYMCIITLPWSAFGGLVSNGWLVDSVSTTRFNLMIGNLRPTLSFEGVHK